jgi:hypothetical protein
MKRLKLSLTATVLFLLAVSALGCSTPAGTFLAGGGVGAAASNTLAGISADLEAQRQKAIAEQQAAIAKLENATDEVEKQALQATIDAQGKKITNLADTQAGVGLAKEALMTDWTDLEALAPWILGAIGLFFGGGEKLKGAKLGKLLTAYKDGVEKYKAVSDPVAAQKIYETIAERKKIEGV